MAEKAFRITKIVLRISFLLILFTLCVTSTHAWLSQNRAVESRRQQLEIADVDGNSIHEYHIYKWDGLTNKGTEVSNNIEGDDLFEKAVALTEYDTVFTDRNVDTPIIIKIVVKEASAGTVHIKMTCPAANHLTGENGLAQYFSNICSIKVMPGNSTINALTEDDAIFTAANTLVKDATGHSFASVNDAATGATDKNTTLTMDVVITDANVVDEVLVLYMQIAYNEDLVSAYLATNNINLAAESAVSGGEDILDFPNDLSSISFTYERDEDGE